jgi:hypothetical protein
MSCSLIPHCGTGLAPTGFNNFAHLYGATHGVLVRRDLKGPCSAYGGTGLAPTGFSNLAHLYGATQGVLVRRDLEGPCTAYGAQIAGVRFVAGLTWVGEGAHPVHTT